jgi:hypothetical protein
LTAVSAIVFFLGLLFGFQRPSRLLLPQLRATVLLLLDCTPFNFGAALFISKRLFCQAAVAASLHHFASLGISTAPLRIAASYRGARNLLRIRVSCQLASSTLSSTSLRLSPLRGAAASTTAALGVNFARRLRISSFTASAGGLRRQCDFAFPSEGRGFYRSALGGVNRSFQPVDSARCPLFPAVLARLPGFMTAFGTCQLHRLVLPGPGQPLQPSSGAAKLAFGLI